jgi:hypothetical protein
MSQLQAQISIYTVQEVYEILLRESLRRAGIDDPSAFLAGNNVNSLCATRLDANVMVVTISSSEPKKTEPVPVTK